MKKFAFLMFFAALVLLKPIPAVSAVYDSSFFSHAFGGSGLASEGRVYVNVRDMHSFSFFYLEKNTLSPSSRAVSQDSSLIVESNGNSVGLARFDGKAYRMEDVVVGMDGSISSSLVKNWRGTEIVGRLALHPISGSNDRYSGLITLAASNGETSYSILSSRKASLPVARGVFERLASVPQEVKAPSVSEVLSDIASPPSQPSRHEAAASAPSKIVISNSVNLDNIAGSNLKVNCVSPELCGPNGKMRISSDNSIYSRTSAPLVASVSGCNAGGKLDLFIANDAQAAYAAASQECAKGIVQPPAITNPRVIPARGDSDTTPTQAIARTKTPSIQSPLTLPVLSN